jgi:hypothetical protein
VIAWLKKAKPYTEKRSQSQEVGISSAYVGLA